MENEIKAGNFLDEQWPPLDDSILNHVGFFFCD